MAKFSRYDPRNKKRGKHKTQTLNKDFRIREVDSAKNKNLLKEVMYDDDDWGNSYLEESMGRDSKFS